jgi:RNA polymerase sigma-70 factor (ECF subfamily)
MLSSLSDDALLAGFAVGDSAAAAAFVRRHQHRVFGVALAVVSDPAVADDVAQEAFTRAWRHAATYDPRRGTVSTWLATITRNAAIDTIRRRRDIVVDPLVLAVMDAPATGAGCDPDRHAELDDDANQLRQALASLPEAQRRAIVLAGICGRSAAEIADIDGIPLGTAKTRIRAGMAKLRVALSEQHTTFPDQSMPT